IFQLCYNSLAVCYPGLIWQGEEVIGLKILFDFVFAIMAEVAAHYICKWLDCKFAKKDSKPTR
ncbi:TPA: hypothetical protein ACPHNJ_002976, partial [Enterococcus faecium]|uniref:hypothetical protein n=3 Tax=Enterococcus faecium TaxID=1352 RepID=UPI00292EF12C